MRGSERICVYSSETGELQSTYDGGRTIESYAIDGAGRAVAAGFGDGSAIVWDLQAAMSIGFSEKHGKAIKLIRFTPDGRHVVTSSGDGTAKLWNSKSGSPAASYVGHTGEVTLVQFSPDGERMLTLARPSLGPRDQTVRVWDVLSGAELACLTVSGPYLRSASLDPSGNVVATTSWDRTTRLWDISKTAALSGPAHLVLAASLASGRGRRSPSERTDLLMQSAPDDLGTAFLQQLSPDERANVERRAAILASPLPNGCYDPPNDVATNVKVDEPAQTADSGEPAKKTDSVLENSLFPQADREAPQPRPTLKTPPQKSFPLLSAMLFLLFGAAIGGAVVVGLLRPDLLPLG